MPTLFATLLFALLTFSTAAQTPFEGTLHFTTTTTSDSATPFTSMFGQGIEVIVKGNDRKISNEGGIVSGSITGYFVDGKQYMIHEKEQWWSDISATPPSTKEIEAVDLHQTDSIMGMACKKYKVEMVEDGMMATFYLWTTTELGIVNVRLDGGFMFGLDGFIVKRSIEMELMGIAIVSTDVLDSVKRHTVNSDAFVWSEEYRVKEEE